MSRTVQFNFLVHLLFNLMDTQSGYSYSFQATFTETQRTFNIHLHREQSVLCHLADFKTHYLVLVSYTQPSVKVSESGLRRKKRERERENRCKSKGDGERERSLLV